MEYILDVGAQCIAQLKSRGRGGFLCNGVNYFFFQNNGGRFKVLIAFFF